MFRPILAGIGTALALSVAPAIAQQSPQPDQPAAQKLDPSLVGMPVYSSDGKKLGQVAEVGQAGGEPAVRAEMGEFLGIKPGGVVIGGKAFERKGDRIEVAMTAQEIKDTITKQRAQRKQK